MSEFPCNLLHDYMAGELELTACRQFQAHLNDCDVCQAEIDVQRAIDAALMKSNSEVATPAGLVDIIEERIQNVLLQRRVWVACAASAALIMIACTTILGFRLGRNQDGAQPVRNPELSHHERIDRRGAVEPVGEETLGDRAVEVTFPAGQNIIAAEFATEDPTVTLFMVYPVIRPTS